MKITKILIALCLLTTVAFSQNSYTYVSDGSGNIPINGNAWVWTNIATEETRYEDLDKQVALGYIYDEVRLFKLAIGNDIDISGTNKYPLLIIAHGNGGSARWIDTGTVHYDNINNEYISFTTMANDINAEIAGNDDIIILSLQGYYIGTENSLDKFSWANIRTDPGPNGVDEAPPDDHDPYFDEVLRFLIHDAFDHEIINTNRIYMTGSSGGAAMTQTMVKLNYGVLAAAAPVNAANLTPFNAIDNSMYSFGLMYINDVTDITVDYGRARMSWQLMLNNFLQHYADGIPYDEAIIERSTVFDSGSNVTYMTEMSKSQDYLGGWQHPSGLPKWELCFVTTYPCNDSGGEAGFDHHDWVTKETHGFDFMFGVYNAFLVNYSLSEPVQP